MRRKNAFTLIELLVVIAIIALLLSIMMPALGRAKKKAIELLSVANMRSLVLAWKVYTEDNDSRLVGGQVAPNLGSIKPHEWVQPVQTTEPVDDHERELMGIRAGALWPYLEDTKVYHSPGDKTWKISATNTPYTTQQSPYRSYAISDAMNGQWRPDYQYEKNTDIPTPSGKFVFIEEEDRNGANWGSWILGNPGSRKWWDPISGWYSEKSTVLGFADGHAQKHMWKDQSTLDMIENQTMGQAPYPGEEEDIDFIIKAYYHDYN